MYSCLRFLPKNHVSYLLGRLAAVRLPPVLQRPLNSFFVRAAHIDMSESEFPIEAYPSIAKLFTRRLKPDVRPLAEGIISPVDGTLREQGPITENSLPQVKGKAYTVSRFLGDETLARRFEGGYFYNLYLSPRDYHRVHSPCRGKILFRRYIPGKLWPVNDWSMSRIDGLFTINERVVVGLQTERGLMAVVMIGATNVGKIVLSFDSLITNSRGSSSARTDLKEFDPPLEVEAGEELGVFHLGSSVVILMEPSVRGHSVIERGAVRFGQTLYSPVNESSSGR